MHEDTRRQHEAQAALDAADAAIPNEALDQLQAWAHRALDEQETAEQLALDARDAALFATIQALVVVVRHPALVNGHDVWWLEDYDTLLEEHPEAGADFSEVRPPATWSEVENYVTITDRQAGEFNVWSDGWARNPYDDHA